MIEQSFGVDADVGSVPGGGGDEAVQVAHRVAGLLRGQIDRVGDCAHPVAVVGGS